MFLLFATFEIHITEREECMRLYDQKDVQVLQLPLSEVQWKKHVRCSESAFCYSFIVEKSTFCFTTWIV